MPGESARPARGPGRSPLAHRWLARVLPPLVALLMLGLSALYWRSEERGTQARQEQNFTVAAQQIASNLSDRMATYETVLRGVKGYFEGSEHIDHDEFHAYVEALQLRQTRPGLQGISYASLLPASALAQHEAHMRANGFADYAVLPHGERLRYAVLTRIEPLEADNRKLLGLDLLTIAAARAAMQRAGDSGALALSAPLHLAANPVAAALPPSLVLFMPIYDTRAPLANAPERRVALQGWVSAPFRLDDVMRAMAPEFDPDIRIEVFDGTATASGALLYASAHSADASSALQSTATLDTGGRVWTLHMTPLPGFSQRQSGLAHGTLALAGAVLSLLLGWFTWLLVTARERAWALASTMTSELRSARDKLESTLNAIPDLLFELDAQGRVIDYRSAHDELLYAQPRIFLGHHMNEVLPADAAAICQAALQEAERTGYCVGYQYQINLGSEPHWFELSIARKERTDDGTAPGFISIARDITDRKLAETRMYQLAHLDTLTSLPNRRLLHERMAQALQATRSERRMGAMLHMDLDNFKQINDAYGHVIGDQLLTQVATRLARTARAQDTVARLGSDEFVILMEHAGPDTRSASAAAQTMAEAIRSVLEQPFVIDTHPYSITGSTGVTLFPKDGETVDDLMREADTARHRAKDMGRNRIRFYETAMQVQVQERLALEQDLKQAQALGQLSAFVQSQTDAAGNVIGGELLMRWHHPVRGNVTPDRFIPIAESSGLILAMGDWMLTQACEALAHLQSAGRALSLSVNVSERQFRQDHFVARVREALAASGARAELLILEVTESLLIENLHDTIARMAELVQIGVRFSIDDFGTGYSSLAYLKRLPLYELKIDKSFVNDTPHDASGTAIVQSIIAIAHHLGLHVVAEGVETRAQADFLTQNRCRGLQGFLFARPEPLAAWLARQTGTTA